MYCPACGDNPISGSSDANLKCKHLKSAGTVRKQKNLKNGCIPIHMFIND